MQHEVIAHIKNFVSIISKNGYVDEIMVFDEAIEGLGALAARPDIGPNPVSLDFDSRFSHGGLQSSAGLGGGKCIPSPPITSSFDGDGIQMSSTADAAENNTDLSSRGFRDDTLLAALDAPTGPLSGLIPETPPCVAAEFTSRLDDQQLLIEALLLRVNQQNKVIKEQADVISELAASSGCADVSPQLPLGEPTTSSGLKQMTLLLPL